MRTKLEHEEKKAIEILSKKYHVVLKDDIQNKIKSEVQEWEKGVSKQLILENPFYENKKALESAKSKLKSGDTSIKSIEDDLSNFQKLSYTSKLPNNDKFWTNEINALKVLETFKNDDAKKPSLKIVKKKNKEKSLKDESNTCRTLLQQKWEQALDEAYVKWELERLESLRRKLYEKLEEWLSLIQQMDDLLSRLSIDTGILFDLSQGNISLSDIEQLKKWAEYISKNEGVKQLCDILGRIRQAEKTSREETIKYKKHITEYIPDINSNEEIVGIKLGRDIEHVLPQELALMADPDTSILFDMKYLEGRLMSFDMHGMEEKTTEIEDEKTVQTSEDETMGPIIICVDTSGSMSGSPENVAKAITLYMATRAKQQKRDCLLINFSTSIETLDMSGNMGLSSVIEFLRKSFHGGTDVDPALSYALEMMKEEKYAKADLLVISDFVMSSLPSDMDKEIRLAKKEKNKFYSLAIGNLFLNNRLKGIFDEELVYNPNNSSIDAIKGMVNLI